MVKVFDVGQDFFERDQVVRICINAKRFIRDRNFLA